MAMDIFRKNDRVKVLTGKDKGKISHIMDFTDSKHKVIVSGVNIQSKHIKPSKTYPEGGIVKKEMPIHISNIMHSLEDGRVSRVTFKFDKVNGKEAYLIKNKSKLIRQVK